MRIVHVVIGGDVAGGQMVALQLARAARDVGHSVAFVSPSDGPFLGFVREQGLQAEVVPVRGVFDMRALSRLTRTFRAQRVDIVHTHGHFAVNVLARLAARIAGAKVLSHMHIQNAFRSGRGRSSQIALDNATARLCFAIVAVSEATRDDLVRQGYPAARLAVIHNGIDPVPRAAPIHLADGPAVIEVARLADVKGQRTLIAAIARLDATAVLVGRDLESGGAYENELRAEAARIGATDRVVFAGYRDDVPALLAGGDIFCLPSTAEGMPLVVLEAMAQARPVVATAVGGTPELVVDGETGILVPPGSVDALADALQALLDDPARAARMGEAGRDRVLATFSAAATVERVLGLYAAAA
ncbi:MAG TPA: glycosyltransferase [Gaiellaceae bacterium]|jgi:glycosyltransferase involved in cell wall biosynthesis